MSWPTTDTIESCGSGAFVPDTWSRIWKARDREANFKNSRSRRRRWLSRSWRKSVAGNDFVYTNDGFNVVVYRRGGTWGARVEHRASGYTRSAKRPYPSQDAAKLAAFDAMLGMKHAEPWRR
jgi:hypothetical protein